MADMHAQGLQPNHNLTKRLLSAAVPFSRSVLTPLEVPVKFMARVPMQPLSRFFEQHLPFAIKVASAELAIFHISCQVLG